MLHNRVALRAVPERGVALKAWYEGCWPLGCPGIAYQNMPQMQLALYEWSAAK